ncbi:MAG TPA: cupredoxin domain-containing protein [Myxococcaceae bacterium]|jgi:plastocyanin|nr:cupredoxin domain-containing protein [Myxococcaceae bacterium]
MKHHDTTLLLLGLLALAAPPAASAAQKGTEVRLTVTEDGFKPSPVKVKQGEPVTLVITRKTDNTCAKSVVIDGADVEGGERISRKLPLNEEVRVPFTPARAGEIRYGCSMNKMVGGVLTIASSGNTASQTGSSPPSEDAPANPSREAGGCCQRMQGVGGGAGGMMGEGSEEMMGEEMGRAMMSGAMGPAMMRDMRPIHGLLLQHEKIRREVKDIPGGVRTLTTSDDPEVAALLRAHVGQMSERIEKGRPIRQMDPLFREIFEHHEKIRMRVEEVPGGVRVTETSDDPKVTLLIRQHARRAVSEFVRGGMSRAMRPTPLPDGYDERY